MVKETVGLLWETRQESRWGPQVGEETGGNHWGRTPMCGMRKEGEVKVGSSLDSQIWYEPYHASMFKLFMKTDLLRSFLMKECKVCNVFWFLVFTNPVLVTSKQLRVHLYPVMSVRKCEYLLVFLLCLVSS